VKKTPASFGGGGFGGGGGGGGGGGTAFTSFTMNLGHNYYRATYLSINS
jgi:hypothetical protein